MPSNFEIVITARGLMPADSRQSLKVRASGRCTYRYRADQMGSAEEVHQFRLPPALVGSIHAAVVHARFFERRSRQGNVMDGDMVLVEAVRGRKRHTVARANAPQRAIDGMVRKINACLPLQFRLRYNALGKLG